MRLRKYYCESPKAKKDKLNPHGCLYAWTDSEFERCEFCNKTFEETRTVWYIIYMKLPYWLRNLCKRPDRQLARKARWFVQRRKRGFDDTELWSLDLTIAAFVEPRLRAFIDTFQARSVPSDMESEDWLEKLEKMHRAFYLIVKEDGKMMPPDSPESKEIEEGLDLFREYFFHLWD
jgi:hypothetical protein